MERIRNMRGYEEHPNNNSAEIRPTKFGNFLLQLSETLKETKALDNTTTFECHNVQQMWFSAQYKLAKFMIEIKSLTNDKKRW